MKRNSVDIPGYRHGQNPIPAASRIGNFVSTGGVHGLDVKAGTVPADPSEQCRHMFANMGAILQAAGVSWDDVLKLNVVISDVEVRPFINREWLVVFPDEAHRPARYISINPHLAKGMRTQCEALAIAGEG
jgi:enamine deaminase RidA (YjgF/YER057c/UK114 family)